LFRLSPDEQQCISIYPGLADASRRTAFFMLPSLLELMYRWGQNEEGATPDDDGFSTMPLILFELDCLDVG
jgi:hypothetical protein